MFTWRTNRGHTIVFIVCRVYRGIRITFNDGFIEEVEGEEEEEEERGRVRRRVNRRRGGGGGGKGERKEEERWRRIRVSWRRGEVGMPLA